MNIVQSILLGIVQGLTEFLPVSSSGHLVLVPHLLGWNIPKEQAFVFDVLVQVATLLAVFAYFWKDLLHLARAWLDGLARRQPFGSPAARMGWYLILATIPAGVIGLALKNSVEAAFASPLATAIFLFITAGLLMTAERAGKCIRCIDSLTWKDALWIGLFQALAIFPGVSRSGSTITGGMTRNLDRETSARFSFLMSIPIMLAAGLAASVELAGSQGLLALLPTFIPGFIAAAVVGYLAIRWLLQYLTRHSLYVFAAYCVMLGLVSLLISVTEW